MRGLGSPWVSQEVLWSSGVDLRGWGQGSVGPMVREPCRAEGTERMLPATSSSQPKKTETDKSLELKKGTVL